MSQLGYDRYAVCGHDIGGMVAHALASNYRRAVTHLMILDVPIPGWSGWEAASAKLWHFGFHMNRDLPERLIQGREYDYVSSFVAERLFNHEAYNFEDIEIFARALAQPGRTRGAMEWYRSFPADNAAARESKLEKLTIPVLALGGDHRLGPQMVDMMKEFAPDVRGGSIADCGHYVAEERPAEVVTAIRAFLADPRVD